MHFVSIKVKKHIKNQSSSSSSSFSLMHSWKRLSISSTYKIYIKLLKLSFWIICRMNITLSEWASTVRRPSLCD